MFRLASKLADTIADLTGGEQQSGHARRIQQAIEDLKALTLSAAMLELKENPFTAGANLTID